MSSREEARRLISQLVDGELDEIDGNLLNDWLKEDAGLRKEYLDAMSLHGLLQWEKSGIDEEGQSTTPASRFPAVVKIGAALLAIAATVVAVLFIRPTRDDEPLTGPIAVVAEAKDARWIEGASESRESDDDSQRFRLESGIARLDLRSGGWLSMVGPADVKVTKSDGLQIREGRVTIGPVRGRTVSVRAGVMRMSSSEGELGLYVVPNRFVEVHALSGSVHASVASHSQQTTNINTGEGYGFDLKTGRKHSVKFSSTFFPRRWAVNADGPDVFGALRSAASPPQSLVVGAVQSDQYIYLFHESSNRTLDDPVRAMTNIGWVGGGKLDRLEQFIPAGTKVDSYLVHFDPIKTQAAGQVPLSGIITFERPIIGIIVGQDELVMTDSSLGNVATQYEPGLRTGYEPYRQPLKKWCKIMDDEKSTMFGFTAPRGILELRVLVEPEETP